MCRCVHACMVVRYNTSAGLNMLESQNYDAYANPSICGNQKHWNLFIHPPLPPSFLPSLQAAALSFFPFFPLCCGCLGFKPAPKLSRLTGFMFWHLMGQRVGWSLYALCKEIIRDNVASKIRLLSDYLLLISDYFLPESFWQFCTPVFLSCSVYSSEEDDEETEMYDHDYDGVMAKTGKRHLGKTRWTREEVDTLTCSNNPNLVYAEITPQECILLLPCPTSCTDFCPTPGNEVHVWFLTGWEVKETCGTSWIRGLESHCKSVICKYFINN